VICRKAFERDLAAFVIDPRDPTWAEFREHYPTCPDCAAEVRAWTELQIELQAGKGEHDPHPSKDLLLSYEERRETLHPAERRMIEGHLACCHVCSDELRMLRGFDFSVLRRPVPRRRERSWRLVRELPSWLRAVVWHPAFAYALVLMLLYPTAMHLRRAGDGLPTEAPAQRLALEATGQPSMARSGAASDGGESKFVKRRATRETTQGIEEDSRLAAVGTRPRRTRGPLGPAGRLARTRGGPPSTPAEGSAPEPARTPALAVAEVPALTGQIASAKPPATHDAAAAERADVKAPTAPDVGGDGSDDLEETEGSERLFGWAPFGGDSGEPHVLGFADTEAPRDDAKRARHTATAAEDAGTGGSWHAIVLAPDRTPEIGLEDLVTGVLLRVPSSALPPGARDVEIRVVGPGDREAVRKIFRVPSTDSVEIRMGAGELATGTYRVLARGIDRNGPSDQVFEFHFVVR
jgi:hypothetical protein